MKVLQRLYPRLYACYALPLLLCMLAATTTRAQGKRAGIGRQPLLRKADTLLFINRNTCKGFFVTTHVFDNDRPADTATRQPPALPAVTHTPFLRISGQVQYDFLYRSYIDTPFSQRNFQQHIIQTALHVTVKDRYPLQLNVSKRVSNSPFFRDFLDVNMRFDKNAYLKHAKQELINRVTAKASQNPQLKAAEAALQETIEKYKDIKLDLNKPDLLARIVTEREKLYYRQLAGATKLPDTLSVPAIDLDALARKKFYKKENQAGETEELPVDSTYSAYYERKKKELDSLQKKVQELQAKTDSIKRKVSKELVAARQKIYKATRPGELQAMEPGDSIESKKGAGFERFLSNIKNIGIGRSVINYSELTAWNVALTGLNIEYNDGLYAALAAGKIDYGFRDFFGKNTRQKGQNFLMGRIGLGDVDHKAIILSGFTGKKYNYGSLVSDTINSPINLVGYAIEGILKKDENTGLSVELAKTTRPVTGRLTENGGMKSLVEFSDNQNLGVSIKGQTVVTPTNTHINGFYRRTGAQFQSFSLFTVNTDQTAWLLNVEQSFWKNYLQVIGSLRRNDFTNPISEKTFKTSTLFKSIQVTARVPRWPSVAVGYYPGTQLYIIDKERIRENAYYVLNASVVHNYKVGGMRMLSSLLYNKYASKGTDTGFISYAGKTYMASQTFIFPRLQLQGMYVYTDQEQMQYYTLDMNGDYAMAARIRAGAGIKYNKIAGGGTYLGSRAQVSIEIKKLGGLQFQYEKSYLPTIYQTLYPIETGRVTWFKYF